MISSGSQEFDLLRDKVKTDLNLRGELEYALALNVMRVDPSDRANRFGSGAAVEWIVAATAYSAGIITMPAGHNSNGFDLRDMRSLAKQLWSVKNQTKKGVFRISNGMGGSGKGFVDPVVFLSPGLPGITFADPLTHVDLASKASDTKDAVILRFADVLAHATNHPECVAQCALPKNDHSGKHDPWMDYVKSLLEPARFPNLAQMFRDAAPSNASVSSEIERLASLRDNGSITNEQFDELLRKL
jgi:hypothetical protein